MRLPSLLLGLALTLGLVPGAGASHIDTREFQKGCGFTEDQWAEGVYDCAGSIPSIQHPNFRTASVGDDWLNDGDLVIGVQDKASGEAKAYPIRILNWHEIVNDEIGEDPIVVTYCPLCGSAVVFERTVNNQTLSFHVSGYLYRQDLVMVDEETHSLWPQIEGTAARGELHGQALSIYASSTVSWEDWKAKHPDTLVLERPRCNDNSTDNQRSCSGDFQRSYGVSPYGTYDTNRDIGISGQQRGDIQGLHPKDTVIGATLEDTSKAYPLSLLSEQLVVNDHIGPQLVVVAFEGTDARIFERADDQTFEPGLENDTIRDQHGNRYDAATGTAITPNGTDLVPIETVDLFWFAWLDHHPTTELYTTNGTVKIDDHEPERGAPGPGIAALVALLGIAGLFARKQGRTREDN